MPIYLVREVHGNAKPQASLEARGLKAKSVTATSLDPVALPDFPQVAYKLYTKLLPAFLLATKNGVTLPTTRPGYNLVDKIENCLPLGFPPVCVTFSQKLSAEEVEHIKNRGAGVIPNKDDTQIRYSFGGENVNTELLGFLYRHNKKVNPRNAAPMGSVNLAAIQSLCKVNAIFTWFLKTQSYPAFSGPVDDIEGEDTYATIEGFVTLKRRVQEGAEVSAKKARTDEEQNDGEEEEMDLDEDAQALDEYNFGDEVSRIPKAKPSTPPQHIFGPISNMPVLPGLVFPYFDGMMEADNNFVASVIRDFFFESLGDEREQILPAYKDLKLHMGLLAMTNVGKSLQHLAVGIRLAIQAQARVYPVIEGGRYTGFTLHGYYFSTSVDGMKYSPKLHNELVKEAASIDEHNVALAGILQKLMKLKMTESKRVPTKNFLKEKKAELSTARSLANFLRQFEMDDDSRDEIEALAVNLSFPQRFWPLDGSHIIKAVDLLLAGSFPEEDTPLYPRGGTLTTKDHRLSIFAAFGDQAFSFRLTGGTPMKVPKTIDLDTLFRPYKGKGGKETIPKPNIIMGKKSLSLCLEDWAAFTSDHVLYAKQSRDAIFRSIVLGGEKAKTFWFDLIKRVGPLTIDDTRKIAVDEVEKDGEELEDTHDSFADFL